MRGVRIALLWVLFVAPFGAPHAQEADSCYSILNLRLSAVNGEAAAFRWELDSRGSAATQVVAVLHDLTTGETVESPADGLEYHIFRGLDRTHEYLAEFHPLCGSVAAEVASLPIVFPHCGETHLAQSNTQHRTDFPIATAYKYCLAQTAYVPDVFYDMDTIWGVVLRRNPLLHNLATTRTLSIWMADSTVAMLGSFVPVSGMTQVAANVTYVLKAQEWDTLMFTTPFVHDGHSGVLFTIDDNTGTSLNVNQSPYWFYHTGYGTSAVATSNGADIDPFQPAECSVLTLAPDARFLGPCLYSSSCQAPMAVAVGSDGTSATIEWVAGEGAELVMEYRRAGTDPWIPVEPPAASPYTLGGLEPGGIYQVRLGVVCAEETRYSDIFTVSTSCAPHPIPFHFTQEEMLAHIPSGYGFTRCWSWNTFYRDNDQLSNLGFVYGANGTWFMLPPVEGPLSATQLRSWIGCPTDCAVRVGVGSLDDGSDIEWVDTIPIVGANLFYTRHEYVVGLASYSGSGNRVVVGPLLDAGAADAVYFFDFHVEPLETCRAVKDLVLDSATSGSLTVRWTPVGEASRWAVYVDGQPAGVADSPLFTVGGLEPYTAYDVAVRGLCGDDDTSRATSATFITACGGEACRYTVAAHCAFDDGWMGGKVSVSALVGGEPLALGSITMDDGQAVSRSFEVCDGMAVQFAWTSGSDNDGIGFDILDEEGAVLYHASNVYGMDGTFFTHACGDVAVAGVEGEGSPVLTPNPACGQVVVSGLEPYATVTILDLQGRECFHCVTEGGSLRIDLSGYRSGAYVVRVVGSRGSVVGKLLVR